MQSQTEMFWPFNQLLRKRLKSNKLGEFKAKRKGNSDSVTVQDATATNVPVPLDQQVHVSFMIYDGEESKSFKDLVVEYMYPAMLAQARFIDQIVLGQTPQFTRNGYGRLGAVSATTGIDFILGTRNNMNVNKAYVQGRNLLLTPNTETQLLGIDLFTHAQQLGDDGQALREAWLGRKFGFNMYMSQNSLYTPTGNTTVTGAINNAAGYAAGTVTFTVDGLSAAISNNSWITIAGDDTPLRVTSTVGGATPTSITVSTGSKRAVVDNAVVTIYTPGQVNLAAGYVAGWAKPVVIDTFTVLPQVGQLISFGTTSTSAVYSAIDVDSVANTILLDRPLVAALADNDKVNVGPAGNYNFAFHRNALALVVRPLAPPKQGTGALSSVINYNDLSMRATITYDGNKQGHLVTLDMLCGIAVLDVNLGAVMYG